MSDIGNTTTADYDNWLKNVGEYMTDEPISTPMSPKTLRFLADMLGTLEQDTATGQDVCEWAARALRWAADRIDGDDAFYASVSESLSRKDRSRRP